MSSVKAPVFTHGDKLLMNCPECGGAVSSQARACPRCGFVPEMRLPVSANTIKAITYQVLRVLLVGFAVYIAALGIFAAISDKAIAGSALSFSAL